MNKTVIVTGGSNGIGAATVILFAEKGYNVILNYNHSAQAALFLQQSLCESGYNVTAIRADVSVRSEVDVMIDKAIGLYGSVDVLVNNAAIAQQKLFTDITEEDWNNMISTNLTGTFNCCQAVSRCMINNKSGCIINISSIWGLTGSSCEVHYSASKAAVIGFTKALAKEFGPSNIRVNCVAPGVVATKMNQSLSIEDLNLLIDETPLGRIGTAEEIANTIFFLADDASGFITGQVISPNGGFYI